MKVIETDDQKVGERKPEVHSRDIWGDVYRKYVQGRLFWDRQDVQKSCSSHRLLRQRNTWRQTLQRDDHMHVGLRTQLLVVIVAAAAAAAVAARFWPASSSRS